MKRKTNLFYFEGDESNFLTFSNYTEHLTGNFLATDFKLFPTRFVCLYIPELNNKENKEKFIKEYLVGYYENKLAFLRDKCIEDNELPDNSILYTNYLFDTIYKYVNDIRGNADNLYDNLFIGNITEQNYNGTFTDIICTIDYNDTDNYVLEFDENKNNQKLTEYNYSDLYLYNWNIDIDGNAQYEGPTNYENVKPLFDSIEAENITGNYYNINSNFKTAFIKNENKLSEIIFNIIIPLYDCVNLNYNTNQTIIDNNQDNISLLYDENTDHLVNIPYGIWFANEDIVLKRDTNTGYTPSWSLLIGTQFKPFPTSKYIKIDNGDDSLSKAYSTFAQIMNDQNNSLKIISNYNNIINDLHNKIKLLESNLNKVIDVTEINKLKETMEEIINRFDISNENVSTKWIYKNS